MSREILDWSVLSYIYTELRSWANGQGMKSAKGIAWEREASPALSWAPLFCFCFFQMWLSKTKSSYDFWFFIIKSGIICTYIHDYIENTHGLMAKEWSRQKESLGSERPHLLIMSSSFLLFSFFRCDCQKQKHYYLVQLWFFIFYNQKWNNIHIYSRLYREYP